MSRLDKGEPVLRTIGTAVTKRRTELALSQEELATKAGLHRTYISDVERGVRNVSIMTLDRIATALELSLGVLLLYGTQPTNVVDLKRKSSG